MAIFSKRLTDIDIGKGLVPDDPPHNILAELPHFGGGQRIQFLVADMNGNTYNFVCFIRSEDNLSKPTFSKCWIEFARLWDLKPGATITFYKEVLSPALSTTDFALQKGETKTITAPTSWGGRRWRRTFCSEDSTGKFSRLTGDCGSSKLECSGSGAAPPATLAEFKLDGYSGMDCFDVSLVDGYNLPMLVVPQRGSGQNCSSTGCVVDLNGSCPSELKVTSSAGDSVACKSASEAFGQPQYCCNGAYSTPDTCKPILLL
ncbi:hypothetical protein GH714_020265 [Hevea brasiliensis]|uniref:TF-B3 domain-containing protein n=1 Tax=Hevea brasiliensis TaxID=3981 RepID=A0A6A6N6U5_HEVBR|nr:hypothetical protein GH714_020265 [Hevea brasiliensis]